MGAVTEREEKLDWLQEQIGEHLHQIAKLFSRPMKLTLVARDAANPDGRHDVLVSDDTAADLVNAIGILARRPERTPR